MIWRSSVTPSIWGIRRSEITRGTSSCCSISSASVPDPASAHVKPSPSSNRTGKPAREVLEANGAALVGGRHGFAFASGLAALDAVLTLLSAGDHVVSGENVYGGSHRQMTHVWARHGLTFSFVDATDSANIA